MLHRLFHRVAFRLLLVVVLLSARDGRAQTPTPQVLGFSPVADTYVDAGSTTKNFGTNVLLKVGGSPVQITYLRFTVTGVNGRHVRDARLRLGVKTGAKAGGSVHVISNGTWSETTVTYKTRPAVDGPALATLATVASGAVVELPLGGAIAADGTYNLALDSSASAGVSYNSGNATSGQRPLLVLTVDPAPPTVTIAQPPEGAAFFAGDPITLQGSAADASGASLSAAIAWRSSLAGALGTGPVVVTALGQGAHVVTASVTDAQGLSASRQVDLVVTPRPPANTEPLVTITAPALGQRVAAGVPVHLTGSASDLEDGTLTPRLGWISDRDGTLGTGGSITPTLSPGRHILTAAVTDSGGLRGSATVVVQVDPAGTREVPAAADATTDASQPATSFGASPLLAVDASTPRIAFLRFALSGLHGRIPTRALLRLHVDEATGAASESGGTVQAISDTGWLEDALTWSVRPALDGRVLATAGPVSAGQDVDLDVTDGLGSDGAYAFALVSASADEVDYRSREGTPAPRLVLTLPDTPPVVTITAPAPGAVVFRGAAVALAATATDAEDGDVAAQVAWTSSLDGPLGTGATLSTSALTAGTHVVTAEVSDADGLHAAAQVTIRVRPPNQPPAVAITSPTDGTSVLAGTPVTLAATATDDFDGDVATHVRWTSTLSGPLGSGTGLSSVLAIGTHVLTAAVTDSDGATGTATVTLTVRPTPPVVTITAPAPGARPFVGTPITFTGTARDAAGTDVSARLRWLSDRVGLIGSGASVTTTSLPAATHTIAAVVTDGFGLTGQAMQTLVVRPPNVPPTVVVTAPAPGATLLAARPVVLGATALDPEDGDLAAAIRWTSSRDGALGTGSALVVPALSTGTHVLTAAVTDHDGAATSATVTVTVVPATLVFPAIADTYVDAGASSTKFGTATSVLVGSSPVRQAFFRFTANGIGALPVQQALLRLTVGPASADASAAGGTVRAITSTTWSEAATTYASRPPLDGTVLDTRPAVAAKQVVNFDVTAAVPGDGTYNFGLASTSTDWVRYASREATTGAPQLAITLGQDLAPVVTITAPASGTSVLPGTPVGFAAAAVDAESGDLSAAVTWRSDRDGTLGTGATLTVSTLSPGHHVITAAAADAAGHVGQAHITLDVAHPPAVTITGPGDGAVFFTTALPLTLSGQALDVEDGNLSGQIAWRSDRDGTLATGATIIVNALSPGTHVITASVTDDDGLRAQASITLRIRLPNVPPVVTIATPADGASFPAGTAVALAAAAHDDFDGDLGARIRWTSDRDGALGTGASLVARLSEGSHLLTATATDSDGASASARVAVTITPTPPVVTIAAPAPGTTVFVGTGVTFGASALDATDGDLSAGIRWTSDRDGLIGVGATIATAHLTVGTHIVRATATDRGGLAGAAERTLVVRPPNVPPALTVRAPATGATLLAGRPVLLAADATDVEDGDLSAGVRWTSSRDGALGSGSPLVAAGLSAGTHTLTATVADRDGATASAAVGVTVAASGLAFTPIADTYVDGGSTSTNFGTATSVLVASSPVRQAFFRFAVAGIGTLPVQSAVLRLTVGTASADASVVGGSVHTLPGATWTEAATTYKTRPTITTPALATVGKVVAAQTVDFDVTPAVTADGTVDLALDSTSTDFVRYATREATTGKPQLLVTFAQDTAPVVRITAPATGTVVAAGAPVTLAAVALDAESGNLGSGIAWRSDLAGALGTGPSVSAGSLGVGIHTITAEVRDAAGHAASAQVVLRVTGPPTVAITAPADGAKLVPGAAALFRAIASDVTDGDLAAAVRWTSSLDGPLGTGATLITGALRSGTHTVTATVANSRGQEASAATTVLVDAPPAVTITAPAAGTRVLPGTPVTFTATASDLEDGNLASAVTWSSSLDGPLGTGATVLATQLRSGAHVVTATVTDAGGRQASAQVGVIVNGLPTVAIVAPADGAIVAPSAHVVLTGTARDPEDGDLGHAIAWTSSLDGALGTGASITAGVLRSGTHTLVATVTDALGATATAQRTLVVDAPPVLAITGPADGTGVSPGDPITLTATATDLEDGDLGDRIAWRSSLDGALGTGRTVTTTALRSGTHTITASVADAAGQAASASVTVTVNAAPTLTITAPAGRLDVVRGEVVHLAATAHDAEDGDLSAAVAWRSDLDGALGTGAALAPTTLRSGTHTITATVTDAGGRTASAQATVVVNAPPTVAIATPADGAVFVLGTPVSLAGTAVDVEDGELSGTLAWSSDLDGVLGTGRTLDARTLRAGTHTITASATDAGGRTGTAHVTVVVDTLPVVAITAPADGTSVAPGDPVALAGSAHDAEDGDLSSAIAWSSDLDGALGTGATPTADHLRSGTHTITATATDAQGKDGVARVTITVDAPPVIAITAPADGTVAVPGVPLAFTAVATDAEEGDLGAAVTWTSDLDGPLGAGAAITVASLRSGTHVVTAAVADAAGKTARTHVVVVIDAPPVVTIAAPADGTVASPGDALELRALATDAEQGDLSSTVTWTSSLDGPLGTGSPLAVQTLRSGTHLLTASVVDAGGKTASAAITLVVDAAPTLAVDTPGDGAVFVPGEGIVLTATAHDAEEGDLGGAVTWTSSLDGLLGTGSGLRVATLRPGTHVLTATVADRVGKTALAHVTIAVDAPPTVTVTAPLESTIVSPGDPVVLAAVARDPEDGDLSAAVLWASSLDGPLGAGSPLTTTLRSGIHTITADVSDTRGETASARVTIVVDAPPTVAITAPADGTVVAPGSPIALAGTATDAEEGDLGATIVWTSSLDGPLGTGRTLDASALRTGTHLLTATVVDASGRTATAHVALTVDAPPSLAIVAPDDGTVIVPGAALTLVATAADAEDGDLGAAIVWTSSLDGPLGTGGTLGVTLDAGVHVLTAMVADSRGLAVFAGVTVVVDALPTIGITAPAAGTFVTPGDVVTLAAVGADAEDGDLGATIAWTSSLDGPLGTGTPLAATLRAGTHVVTATVADHTGRTAIDTRTVVVDAPPTVTIGAPADGTTLPPDPVALSAVALDAEDGDLGARIVWTSSLGGVLGTGRSLQATLASGVHVLTASVTDGDGRSASASIGVVVAPLVTLSGGFTKTYAPATLTAMTRIDARAATFFAGPTNLYPINLTGDVGVHLLGGTVLGQYDRTLSWDQMHNLNNAGVVFANASFTVDGLRIDNVTDGVRPKSGGDFTIRNTRVTYARDDCVEDDHLQGGLIDDTLFDGCYTGISSRPSPAIIDSGYDGRGKVITIQNSLMRLQPMPGPRGGSADNLGTEGFFKWHNWDTIATSLSPDLVLTGNVFMAERVGQVRADRMGIPPGHLRSCANNVMVWLGSGPFPATLPSCFTVTTDRSVWDAAVASWIARHPDVAP